MRLEKTIWLDGETQRFFPTLLPMLAQQNLAVVTGFEWRLNGECAPDLMLMAPPPAATAATLQAIRLFYNGPVLVCGDEPSQELMALKQGADAFVLAGLPLEVLLARISAWLRRPLPSEMVVKDFGPLRIDFHRREAWVHGQLCPLNSRQFDLLVYFATRPGVVLERTELYQALLQREFNGLDRTIDIQVSRLRRLLGDACCLKTIRGQGYLFCLPHPSKI